jgi:hypothetical protein
LDIDKDNSNYNCIDFTIQERGEALAGCVMMEIFSLDSTNNSAESNTTNTTNKNVTITSQCLNKALLGYTHQLKSYFIQLHKFNNGTYAVYIILLLNSYF